MPTNGEIARREIQRLRDGGMTLSQIAAMLDINASTLASVANGEIENPNQILVTNLQQLPTPEPVEQRSYSGVVTLNDDKRIEGMAAVYYDGSPATEFQLSPRIVERIHPGSFNTILESGIDILALYNHDEIQFLGRRASGTLKLTDAKAGLHYSIPFDPTDPVHQTVAARIARRDVVGSSFAFDVGDQRFEKRSDGIIIRNIYSYKRVIDVGPTHLPAYPGTSAEFRSARMIERLAEEFLVEPPTQEEFAKYLR